MTKRIALIALLLTASCTTLQKILIWEAIEEATRDDATPPPPVVAPAPTPAPEGKPPAPAPCQTWETPPATMKGGGVWKPMAESGHKLVVLVNTRFRGHIVKCEILRADWTVIEAGRFDGDTHNGCRPHFRFSKPGAEYGTDLILRLTLKDGTERAHVIPDGARRWDW